MKTKTFFLFLLFALLLLSSARTVHANSSSLYRSAGTVEPVQNNSVRMVEEKVYIQVYGGWSVVCCEFIFRNESREARDVPMGFPASLVGIGFEIDETTRLRDFRIFDNGMEREAKLEEAGTDSGKIGEVAEWYTWDVRFQGEEERRIVNTYKTQNYNAQWERGAGYILKTGASWKGPIGKANISFELMDIAPYRIDRERTRPHGYRVEQNRVIWELYDFEPTEDINLTLSGYIPISDLLLERENVEQKEIIRKQLEQTRMLFMDGNEAEGVKQADLLLEQGLFAEELYFHLLNYYHKQNDVDTFTTLLKEQIQCLNSPNIPEWAESLYPERLKEEGIAYPDDHKPVIANQNIRKFDKDHYELSADLYDEAGDMTFFSAAVYADALTLDSLLPESGQSILFGYKDYIYRVRGKLPNAFSDLICRMEVNDYKGDAAFGISMDTSGRPGESCYFYTGKTFELWNIKKGSLFTLCWYDNGFDSMEARFRETLSDRLDTLTKKGEITVPVPEGGYIINLYEKSHLAALQKGSPQNITKYLKGTAYKAKRHNYRTAWKREMPDEEWDWGEVLVELDYNDTEKMVQDILQQVTKKQFGTNLAQNDSEGLDIKDNDNRFILIITIVLVLIGGVVFLLVRKNSIG